MEQSTFDLPRAVFDAFTAFAADEALLALPLKLSGENLHSLPPSPYPKDPNATFQAALSRLDTVISPKIPLYLILRRDNALTAITYIPHLAPPELKTRYLDGRHELVKKLGESCFKSSLICKEAAEITDVRSWEERDMHASECKDCSGEGPEAHVFKDMGHQKNKCRLCDRRMKNKIEETAAEALKHFSDSGDCVQLSVDMETEILKLNFSTQVIPPSRVSSRLPVSHPSFTFYKHLESQVTYFVFCSPDSVPVKERMTHTMAIPGLINIIAKESGLNVDQKIEIHDPDELVFEERDTRIGKFRSMYLRNEFVGTESTWENMEASQKILDSVK